MTVYLMCFALFLVGLYGLITKRDLIKIILSIGIMSYAANLMFILFSYKRGGIFPILQEGVNPQAMVDPLPQALVLTAIVIELGSTALLVALAVKLFDNYNTFDITKIKRLSG
jgi:multicomponent Na+:H+ antiporter subunit C